MAGKNEKQTGKVPVPNIGAHTENREVSNLNEKENELIRKTFFENDDLLKAIRALLFGLGASKPEKEMVRATFADDAIFNIVRKRFLPHLDKDAPIGQVSDVWLGVESMVFGAQRDQIEQAVRYKAMAVDMTEKGLALLKNPDGEQISVDYDPDFNAGMTGLGSDALQIWLLARNQYVRHVEQQLLFLKLIASKPKETKKEAEERRGKDSAR